MGREGGVGGYSGIERAESQPLCNERVVLVRG